ncbi:YgaP-like transmembrane domain [Natrialbaceae archaeon A-CW3]
MRKNVGGRDRRARIVLGLVSVAAMMVTIAFGEGLGDPAQGIVAAVLLLLAFAFLGTAGAEKCPINRTLGRNTYDDPVAEERP